MPKLIVSLLIGFGFASAAFADIYISGFVDTGGLFTPVNYPGATQTYLYGVNNSGQIVGQFGIDGSTQCCFVDTGGVFTTFSGLTFVYGINDSGQVVGSSSNSNSGVVDTGGLFTPVNYPGAAYSRLTGINDSGQVVGEGNFFQQCGAGAYQAETYQGFVETGGVYTPTNYPGAAETYVSGINDRGQIVGAGNFFSDACSQGSSSSSQSFVETGGVYTPINYPGAIQTFASGINDRGQVVGYFVDSSGAEHGFVETGGVYTPINYPGSPATNPEGINANGEIVGSYLVSNQAPPTITPEPDLCGILAVCILGLLVAARRKGKRIQRQ
jgi:probable HAF family extracellular repeat protein